MNKSDKITKVDYYTSSECLKHHNISKGLNRTYICPVCKEDFLITTKRDWIYKLSMLSTKGRPEYIMACSYNCLNELKTIKERGIPVESQLRNTGRKRKNGD